MKNIISILKKVKQVSFTSHMPTCLYIYYKLSKSLDFFVHTFP